MLDQASELRKLVREAAAAKSRSAPTCVTVCGAGRGAGATSSVTALARSLSRHGVTIVLDAGPLAAATDLLGAESLHGTCEDVLSGQRQLPEIVQEAGQRLLLAPGGGTIYPWQHQPGVERLWRQLSDVDAQFAVLDAGSTWHTGMRTFYEGGSELLMIATSDPEHVLNAYALIKSLTAAPVAGVATASNGSATAGNGSATTGNGSATTGNGSAAATSPEAADDAPVGCASLLVNRADELAATEIHQRLGTACQRFLGKQIQLLYSPDSFQNHLHPSTPLHQAAPTPAPSWQAVIDVWADHLAEVRTTCRTKVAARDGC